MEESIKKTVPSLFIEKCGKPLSHIVAMGEMGTYIRVKNEISMIEAFEKGVKISYAKKANRNLTEDVISFILTDLSNALNIGKNLSSYQIFDLTFQIIKDFPYLSFEELIVVFERFKKGLYGIVYDRLDGQIINEIITKYESEERADLLEKKHRKIKDEEKTDLRIKGSAANFICIAAKSEHPAADKLRDQIKELENKKKKVDLVEPPHLKSIQNWITANEKLIPTLADQELLVFRLELLKGIKNNNCNEPYKNLLQKVNQEIDLRKEKLIERLPELTSESLEKLIRKFKEYKAKDIEIILKDELLQRKRAKAA